MKTESLFQEKTGNGRRIKTTTTTKTESTGEKTESGGRDGLCGTPLDDWRSCGRGTFWVVAQASWSVATVWCVPGQTCLAGSTRHSIQEVEGPEKGAGRGLAQTVPIGPVLVCAVELLIGPPGASEISLVLRKKAKKF